MRFLVGLICALALGAVPVAGCSDSEGTGGGGGNGGAAGAGGASGTGGSGGTEPACEGTVCACTETGIRAAVAQGGGPFTFDCNAPTTVVTSKRIVIDRDVILDGQGNLTIDGNDDHPVVFVLLDVVAEFHGLAITGGQAGRERAGGIDNTGTLTMVDCEVVGNSALGECDPGGTCAGGGGGGISNSRGGILTIVNSTVSDNIADAAAGGIVNSGNLTIASSIVSANNIAGDPGRGGGILNSDFGELTIENSVVSANVARDGGGIYNAGILTITNSTISTNAASNAGGGIFISGRFPELAMTSLTMVSSTVSSNSATTGSAIYSEGTEIVDVLHNVVQGDCANEGSTFGSSGYNIESPGNTCGFDQMIDLVNVTAELLNLGPLADNGGPTMTHALGAVSVAIDVIEEADCVDAEGQPLTTDQRGDPRPAGDGCDVGAFEVQGSN